MPGKSAGNAREISGKCPGKKSAFCEADFFGRYRFWIFVYFLQLIIFDIVSIYNLYHLFPPSSLTMFSSRNLLYFSPIHCRPAANCEAQLLKTSKEIANLSRRNFSLISEKASLYHFHHQTIIHRKKKPEARSNEKMRIKEGCIIYTEFFYIKRNYPT